MVRQRMKSLVISSVLILSCVSATFLSARPAMSQTPSAEAVFEIEPRQSELPQNEEIAVNIKLTTTRPTDAAGFQLSWMNAEGTASLRCTGIQMGTFYINGMLVGQGRYSDNGTIEQYAIGLLGQQRSAGSGTLAVVRLRATETTPLGVYRLHLFDTQASLAGEELSVATIDGEITVIPPRGPQPPIAPTNLRATRIDYNLISLAWQNNYFDVDRFRIERDDGQGFRVIREADNVTSYTDTPLSPDTVYRYRVCAHNAQGYSGYSNILEVRTWPVLPAAPTDFRVISVTKTTVRLSWKDNAVNETGYRLERAKLPIKMPDSTFGYSLKWDRIFLPANTTSYEDTNLASSSSYYYRLFAVNAHGDSPPSDTLTVKTMEGIPLPPSKLKVESAAAKKVKIVWQDNAVDELGFIVERSDPNRPGDDPARFYLNIPNTTSYIDTLTTDGKSYVYRVCATNSHGQSEFSNSVRVDIPAAPTELKTELVGYTQIELTWKDNATEETAYYIERAPNMEFWPTEIERFYMPPNSTKYTDTATKPTTGYYYRVVAQKRYSEDLVVESPPSNIATMQTRTPPNPKDVKTNKVNISNFIDENGITKKRIVITSLEGIKSLEISERNQLLTYDDKPLETIEASQINYTLSLLKSRVIALPTIVFKPVHSSLIPPVSMTQEYRASIVGPVVDLQPSGARFFKGITITMSYPDYYPAEMAERDLFLAYYDSLADKWVELPSRVNTTAHTVTADISHFSTIGIIRKDGLVVDYWRIIAVLACELLIALLLIILFMLIRQRMVWRRMR